MEEARRKRSVAGRSRMTSRIGEKVKGGPNGREDKKMGEEMGLWEDICHSGHHDRIISRN